MIFPLINGIYKYNGKKEIIWQQDLFTNVYLRSIPENEEKESKYTVINWWKFMWNAKKIGTVKVKNDNY